MSEEDDADTVYDFILPAVNSAASPDFFMYKWTNGEMRECIDVVVNLGSGTTSYSTTNVTVSVRDDGERSYLLLTHKWNETMMDANQIFGMIKDADKDVNYHHRMAALRVFLANTFGMPGHLKKESTAKIPLPLKVRDVNPKITVMKKSPMVAAFLSSQWSLLKRLNKQSCQKISLEYLNASNRLK